MRNSLLISLLAAACSSPSSSAPYAHRVDAEPLTSSDYRDLDETLTVGEINEIICDQLGPQRCADPDEALPIDLYVEAARLRAKPMREIVDISAPKLTRLCADDNLLKIAFESDRFRKFYRERRLVRDCSASAEISLVWSHVPVSLSADTVSRQMIPGVTPSTMYPPGFAEQIYSALGHGFSIGVWVQTVRQTNARQKMAQVRCHAFGFWPKTSDEAAEDLVACIAVTDGAFCSVACVDQDRSRALVRAIYMKEP